MTHKILLTREQANVFIYPSTVGCTAKTKSRVLTVMKSRKNFNVRRVAIYLFLLKKFVLTTKYFVGSQKKCWRPPQRVAVGIVEQHKKVCAKYKQNFNI